MGAFGVVSSCSGRGVAVSWVPDVVQLLPSAHRGKMLSDTVQDPTQVPPTAPGQAMKEAETEPNTAPQPRKYQPNPLPSAYSAPWGPAGSHITDTSRKLLAHLDKTSCGIWGVGYREQEKE